LGAEYTRLSIFSNVSRACSRRPERASASTHQNVQIEKVLPILAIRRATRWGRADTRAVGDELFVHRVEGRQPHLIPRGDDPHEGHEGVGRIEDLGSIVLDEGPAFFAPPSPGRGKDKLDRTSSRHRQEKCSSAQALARPQNEVLSCSMGYPQAEHIVSPRSRSASQTVRSGAAHREYM
jgi:hypothetical protein